MKLRKSIIDHPSGIKIETPLLIPSYSSKGFSINTKDKSELYDVMILCKEFLTESSLVSAYDLFYKHIPIPKEFVSTEVVFIDSGGYETSQLYDLSGINKHPRKIKDWQLSHLESVIKKWPKQFPAVIVNYDHGKLRKPIEDQILSASQFFSKFPDFASDFIIKPEKNTINEVPVDKIITQAKNLSSFDIIGLTEKELGNSILKRMVNIATIRNGLDDAGILKPLHIFGCLDPITTILYFMAGAEIFDGLTWLKYSYNEGLSIYVFNYGSVNKDIGIHTIDRQVRIKSLTNNIYFLEKLKYRMKEYIDTNDFKVFDSLSFKDFSSFLNDNYNIFLTEFKK